jgi:hypothetical protein
MKSPKKTKKKSSGHSGGGGAQQFLIWHGEKIAVGIVVVIALWFAAQGLGRQSLSWRPEELEEVATAAEKAIKESTRSAEDEEIKLFDYAAYAEQIKEPIPAEPYRTQNWNPAFGPRSSSSSSGMNQ